MGSDRFALPGQQGGPPFPHFAVNDPVENKAVNIEVGRPVLFRPEMKEPGQHADHHLRLLLELFFPVCGAPPVRSLNINASVFPIDAVFHGMIQSLLQIIVIFFRVQAQDIQRV